MPHYNLPHNHGQNMERVLNKMPHTEDFTDIAFLFQQLGDPTRLRILWLLCHCDECVCNIAAAVDMSAPAVSHHLRILKKSGIISSRRDGKEVYNTKLLFGIFCLMLTLVFLYTLTALGFNGNDSAFIILVLAVISLVTGLIFGILGILSSRKK